MIHRIKITENSDGTERGTQNQLPQILLLTGKAHVIPFHQNECKEKCHQIPEKAFLNGRQISRQPDKQIHQLIVAVLQLVTQFSKEFLQSRIQLLVLAITSALTQRLNPTGLFSARIPQMNPEI